MYSYLLYIYIYISKWPIFFSLSHFPMYSTTPTHSIRRFPRSSEIRKSFAWFNLSQAWRAEIVVTSWTSKLWHFSGLEHQTQTYTIGSIWPFLLPKKHLVGLVAPVKLRTVLPLPRTDELLCFLVFEKWRDLHPNNQMWKAAAETCHL